MLNELFERLCIACPGRFRQYDDNSIWDKDANTVHNDYGFGFWQDLANEVGLPSTLPIPDGYTLLEGLALFVVEEFEEKALEPNITDLLPDDLLDVFETSIRREYEQKNTLLAWTNETIRNEILLRMNGYMAKKYQFG